MNKQNSTFLIGVVVGVAILIILGFIVPGTPLPSETLAVDILFVFFSSLIAGLIAGGGYIRGIKVGVVYVILWLIIRILLDALSPYGLSDYIAHLPVQILIASIGALAGAAIGAGRTDKRSRSTKIVVDIAILVVLVLLYYFIYYLFI